MYWLNKPSGRERGGSNTQTVRKSGLSRNGGRFSTSHSFVYELFTGIKVSVQHESVVQVSEHLMLQSDPSLLLQRLKGLCVVMLSEMFEAKADGFPFSVLQREQRTGVSSLLLAAAKAQRHKGGGFNPRDRGPGVVQV